VNAQVTILTNGTVIDGTGTDPVPDGSVVIRGDRIAAVGPRAPDVPPGAQVIDAEGGTILPGIIDAHVHSAADPTVRRDLLTAGVTAVCDLGSPLDSMPQFAQERVGQDPVARGFRAGPILTAPGGLPDAVLHENLNYEVGTVEQARAAVADLLGRGADVIKVYFDSGLTESFPMLDLARARAITEEAHARGVLVRAHVTKVTLWELALESRVDAIEHVPKPALTETDIQTRLADSSDPENDLRAMFRPPEYETLLPKMVEQGTIMVPTFDRGTVGALSRQQSPSSSTRSCVSCDVSALWGASSRWERIITTTTTTSAGGCRSGKWSSSCGLA